MTLTSNWVCEEHATRAYAGKWENTHAKRSGATYANCENGHGEKGHPL